MVAPRPALSLLLAVLACSGPVRPSPPLLLRPRERERDSGGVNIAVVHSGSSLLPETSVVAGGAGANVIYLAVNESSPGTLLLQLCELLATTPLQVVTPPAGNHAPNR
ncbi:hypothetical protein EYF80_064988 [Liparis tanakae]|uniref:Uncharacterized protein n=1 Tax=Liparis tanakae TaxID=230148 RepID=A0A4Z2E7H1_9TELE|nr:hypothetical protein EYF80_064988 [Liparis tanakae]